MIGEGEGAVPQMNVGREILKGAVDDVATKKMGEFVHGADTVKSEDGLVAFKAGEELSGVAGSF